MLPRVRDFLTGDDDPVVPLFRVLFDHLVDDLDADDTTWTASYQR